jgi:phage gp36-like protein
MGYAVKADITPRRISTQEIIELTNDTGGGAANDPLIETIITEASATIDSYCRNRYSVPLQPSEKIESVCVDLVVYELFKRRRRVDEDIQRCYDDAMSFLRDVSTGKAALDQPAGADPQQGSLDSKPTQKAEKFSDTNLTGYV